MVARYEYNGGLATAEMARRFAEAYFAQAFSNLAYSVEHVYANGSHQFTATIKE